ncbi:MAG: YigZ family protein [Prevotellaceae bacterium]|jgi:uncharacterized YigZ family protein|nr:YigZ family protein [Prevotellaceae bacterium]
MDTDNYKTIAAPATGLFKDKGSKFLAFAYPVDDEAQVKAHVQRLKKEYFDARHHCFAYRIGLHGEQWRANDDGEPASTGGKPILGQLLSRELTDTLVVVVRYFGGILLGVPGLINAYRSAAADALNHAPTVEKTATVPITFSFPYSALNTVMKWLKNERLEIRAQHFDTECRLEVDVPLSKRELITNHELITNYELRITGKVESLTSNV